MIVRTLCELLVRLHPRRIRGSYGEEMLQVVEASRVQVEKQNWWARSRVALRSVWGLSRSLLEFWWDETQRRPTPGLSRAASLRRSASARAAPSPSDAPVGPP